VGGMALKGGDGEGIICENKVEGGGKSLDSKLSFPKIQDNLNFYIDIQLSIFCFSFDDSSP